MPRVHRPRRLTTLAGTAVLAVTATAACASAAQSGLTVDGRELAGATLAPGTTVEATVPGAVSVKFLLDGTYLGTDRSAPFTWSVSGSPGPHRMKARAAAADGEQTRLEADFAIGTGTAPPPPAPSPTPSPSTSPDTAAPPPPSGAPVTVSTTAQLRDALATAGPGAVITLADGTYRSEQRLVASANGTATAPITLRGSRAAVLMSTGPRGNYGLHVTGDHWRVLGITVADATKGIVLDGSVGTVLDGVEVRDIGDEGVHFRSCSSDGVLRNSSIRNTGLRAPRYGEGVYVGSASSNWSKYACTDGKDNSENVLVEGNTFRDTTAEGADLKEGTDSGVLRGNVFENTGWSGENSADSAVDVKGNGWLVEGNTVRGASGAFLDAFQTHTVSPGYGTGNTFRGNRVEGPVPGFGFGLYPRSGNVVSCDNSAPGAARGLVGDGSKPTTCS